MEISLLEVLHPLHPRFVHFPIALIFSAMGMQALGMLLNKDSLRNGAWLMFILAIISMPIVVLTGFWEERHMHLNHPVLTLHKRLALTVLWFSMAIFPILWLLRSNRIFHTLFLSALIIISILIGLAAHQGGRMVFEYGVGVS